MKTHLLVVVAILNACGPPKQIRIESPQFKATYLPGVTLAKSKQECWTTVLTALKARTYELATTDEATGSIETGRRKYNVNATMTSGSAAAIGQMEQSDKLWIKVTGDDHQCQVEYVKARLWNGEEELASVQSEGGDWYLRNVIRPLNGEIAGH